MDTQSIIQIPGYKYNECLLVLNPHEGLQDKIMQVKKEFAEKHKATTALYSKPHITLVNFIQFEMIEERLINRLKTIATGYASFQIDLKDYGSFPSHTIYINIASKQQVQNLEKALRPAQQLMTLNKDNKPHFINDPYIVVGRKLLPWQYEKGWLDFSNRHFSGRFIADSMLLLKRPLISQSDRPGLTEKSDGISSAKKYQLVQRFGFMNLSANIKQGELFIQ